MVKAVLVARHIRQIPPVAGKSGYSKLIVVTAYVVSGSTGEPDTDIADPDQLVLTDHLRR